MEVLEAKLIANQAIDRLVELIEVQKKLIDLYKEKVDILERHIKGAKKE